MAKRKPVVAIPAVEQDFISPATEPTTIEEAVIVEKAQIRSFHDSHFFLNTLSRCEILVDLGGGAILFPSLEHAFQAAKSLDHEERMHIATLPVIEALQYGRRELKHPRSDFGTIRLDVMRRLLELKFQNPWHRRKLMETGDAIIINENEYNDTYWGINKEGEGRNWLGGLIQQLRDKLAVTDAWLYTS